MLLSKCKGNSKIYKPYLFFISFSLLSLSHTFLCLSLSSLTSLHTLLAIFMDSKVSVHRRTCGLSILFYHSCCPYTRRTKHSQNLNGLSIVFYCSHSSYMRRMKCSQNLNGLSLVFYHSHSSYMRHTKHSQTTAQCGACSSLPQLLVV